LNNILRGRIVQKYGTLYRFGEAMGLSPAKVTWRLNGKTNWKSEEIVKATRLLGIQPTELALYFFPETLGVSEEQSNA